MAVHFKFRSSVESDSINIDRDSISIADLKEKIAQYKNLGKNTNFDLVITNAHTGEEYTNDHDEVLKNTSVLIKRVPAARPKSTLLVNDRVTFDVSDQASTSQSCTDNVLGSTLFSDADSDDINNYGVGLYSVPGLVPEWSSTVFGTEENNEIVDMVTKTSLDHQRQTKEPCSSGEGSERDYNGRDRERGKGSAIAIPPAGYVCHCCGQKGHFIQHCPENSDLVNDVKKANLPKTKLNANQEGATIQPDGSIGILQPDENVVSKEHSFRRPASAESPPELRCPICQAIFKDAVMIPCCNYSFCDKCIRRDLVAKGQCPQCESTKFKDKDLLPNIALRLAIDRFFELSTQPPMDITGDGATNTQPVPGIADAGSATRANKASPGSSSLKVALDENKPVPSFKLMDPVIIAESVCESAVESKEKCASDHTRKISSSAAAAAAVSVEGLTSKEKFPSTEKLGLAKASVGGVFSRISQPLVTREEGVSSEAEVMQGKRRKKPIRPLLTDGIQEQKATVKTSEGCSVRPNIMPAYPPQMYWHGPSVPPMRPYPLSYGDRIYGHMPLPFDPSSMMPINAFGNPFMHPMYRGPPFHGGGVIGSVATGMVVPAQRPLSREEFMELQDWERRRRLMIEERENEESSSSGSELKPCSQRQLSVGERQSHSFNCEVGIDYSDEDTDNGRSKNSSKYNRDNENRWKTQSNDGVDNDDDDDEQKIHEVGSSDMKTGSRHRQHQLSKTGLSSYIEKHESSFSAHSRERISKENSTRSSTEKCLRRPNNGSPEHSQRNRKYESASSKKPESEYNHHRDKRYVYGDKYGSQNSRRQAYEDKHGSQSSRRQISGDKHGSQSARRRVSEDKHESQSSRRKVSEDNHGSRSSRGKILEAVAKDDSRFSKFDFSESDCNDLSRKNPTSQSQRHSLEAELKKRKRSQRTHRDDHLERKDSKYDLEGLRAEKRRHGRHRNSDDVLKCSESAQERQNPGTLSHVISSSSLDESLGESRWQMGSELGNAENTYFHSLSDYGRDDYC